MYSSLFSRHAQAPAHPHRGVRFSEHCDERGTMLASLYVGGVGMAGGSPAHCMQNLQNALHGLRVKHLVLANQRVLNVSDRPMQAILTGLLILSFQGKHILGHPTRLCRCHPYLAGVHRARVAQGTGG